MLESSCAMYNVILCYQYLAFLLFLHVVGNIGSRLGQYLTMYMIKKKSFYPKQHATHISYNQNITGIALTSVG